jgi:menaquinone-specific isochorismate synthase
LVRRHIETQLAPLSETIVCDDEPHLERLQHVQHLRTDVRGTLRPGVRDADVLAALHPTPAVCGLPTERAMSVLRDVEGFDRGLYCGLVGLWRADEAEFAVAIRSALICGREVQLYAGAGIVDGSDADAEWDETVDKLRTIGDVIGGDPCDD